MENLKEQQTQLYEKWKTQRGYEYFVYDGILNYEKWNSISPKVMFLLKETADDFIMIADEPHNVTTGNGPHFWWNICYWKYLIDKMYKNEEVEFIDQYELPEVRFNNNILDSIAYVNIKKDCENKTQSSDSEIKEFAKSDGPLLVEQIDLINPDIIFCNNVTFVSYKYIYNVSMEKLNDICYKHKNRLILKYKHPSYFQISGGRETLFNNLKKALSENDSILNQFNWGK